MTRPEHSLQQRIADCRELYLKYGGRRHEQIEREMRGLGHAKFRRRIMYTRRERGRICPGWIERFGWRSQVRSAECGMRSGTNRQKARRVRKIAQRIRSSRLLTPRFRSGTSHSEIPHSAFRTPQLDGDFQAWLKRVSPGMTWDWRHQRYIYERLQRITDGTCKRLMIFLPPRHGKSELVTVRYTAWRLRKDPALKVILAGYNQSLSNNFSRKIKNVLCEDSFLNAETQRRGEDEAGGQMMIMPNAPAPGDGNPDPPKSFSQRLSDSAVNISDSPFPFTKTRLKNTEAEWETTVGGGLRAVGVGGGVTGFGAQLIVIDDPVKSRAEAESPKIREKVWNWFNDDLYTRLEPEGSIVLIQTRWHEDDLAGRLLKQMEEGGEQWEVISLPAFAEAGNAGALACMDAGVLSVPGAVATGVVHGTEDRGLKMENAETDLSLKGTKIIAQGKAAGRNPGYNSNHDSDPEGVEQTTGDVAPLQGANGVGTIPGVTLPSSAHPRLLSLSPSATGKPQPNDPLDRKPGEALCPERFNVEALENLQRQLGTYSFSALYQQRPTPAEGMIFKRKWFKTIVKQPPPGLKWCRGYDLAVSTKTTADYTASFRVAYNDEGNLYIDGGFRKRVEFPDQRRYILGRIAAEHDTEHGIELALHGQGIMQELRRSARLQGRRFRGIQVEGDKLTRALKWSSLAEEGRVILVRGGWNADFIDEACSFPGGQFDDQIDAVSIAVRMHERQGGRLIRF